MQRHMLLCCRAHHTFALGVWLIGAVVVRGVCIGRRLVYISSSASSKPRGLVYVYLFSCGSVVYHRCCVVGIGGVYDHSGVALTVQMTSGEMQVHTRT